MPIGCAGSTRIYTRLVESDRSLTNGAECLQQMATRNYVRYSTDWSFFYNSGSHTKCYYEGKEKLNFGVVPYDVMDSDHDSQYPFRVVRS